MKKVDQENSKIVESTVQNDKKISKNKKNSEKINREEQEESENF